MARKYVIINTSELSGVDYNELLTTSQSAARQKLADYKEIVSSDGTRPSA